MAAFALMLIGFSQTAGDARAFAVKHHYQIDINQESVAQALANTGAGGSHPGDRCRRGSRRRGWQGRGVAA
jgi:MFS superfamily sulfate permease-like transporter